MKLYLEQMRARVVSGRTDQTGHFAFSALPRHLPAGRTYDFVPAITIALDSGASVSATSR